MTTTPFLKPKETAKQTSATVRNETVHMSLYGTSASPESERRHTAYMDFDSIPDVEVLARQQGVSSDTKFENLLGDFWPENQSVEDFLEARRRWRREGHNSDD